MSIEFPDALPYDHMHQSLLGLVQHVLYLKCVQSINFIKTFNTFMMGNTPLPLSELSKYKAEDFKDFGLYYEDVLFRQPVVSRNLNQLWVELQKLMEIALDPTPMRKDIDYVRQRCSVVHYILCNIFILYSPTRFVWHQQYMCCYICQTCYELADHLLVFLNF